MSNGIVCRHMLCCYWGGECDLKKWLGGGGDGASAVVHDVYKGPSGAKKVYEYLYNSPPRWWHGQRTLSSLARPGEKKTTIKESEPYYQKMCLIALSSFPVCFGKYRKPVKYPTRNFKCNPLFVFAKFDTHNGTKRLQGTRREGENMAMARICYFRDKCGVFAHNCKFPAM